MQKAFLSDEQWEKIEPLLPCDKSGGRPWADNRRVVEGIFWVLKTGARWRDLPKEYPSPSTCWRRLRRWEKRGVWLNVWRAFLSELDQRHKLNWSESFLDGSFAPAKLGMQKAFLSDELWKKIEPLLPRAPRLHKDCAQLLA